MDDAAILAACPDFISIGAMLKATPRTEGARRFCYFEASNEGRDYQDESIAAKALADSSDYYLRYGNVDIDHMTLLGAPNPAKGWAGVPDYQSYEIGRPVEVGQRGESTFVKSEIYSGDGKAAERANLFWDSIADTRPPHRWYPSVGGSVLERTIETDPATKMRKAIVKRVRWANVGVSKTPVNPHLPTCATIPLGVFAKCMTPGGLDIAKAIEAGYGTDSATLTGGGSMRKQSLEGAPLNYFDLRNKLAAAVSAGEPKSSGSAGLINHCVEKYGMAQDEAAEHVERFMRDLHTGMKRSH